MRRREFITLVAGGIAAWPLASRAQQPKAPVIGLLMVSSPLTDKARLEAFVRHLRELGWIDSRNICIETRFAEGRRERFVEAAAEFARLKVDVILTAGAAPVLIAKQAAPTTPIVFAIASDPVGTGLVTTLARPGGNITGLSYIGPDLAAKRIELTREVLGRLGRMAIMANRGAPGAMVEMREIQTTAGKVGLEIVPFEIEHADEIAAVFVGLKDRADALYVCADPLVNANRMRIVTSALEARVPTVFGERENIDVGGLFSYGPNVPDMFRRAAEFVDKILRGTKPADIPVEEPTKFEFIINLKTAKALGLAVPPSLLARADEVIE
jgi:putative ABC transport system substrate-binding protein